MSGGEGMYLAMTPWPRHDGGSRAPTPCCYQTPGWAGGGEAQAFPLPDFNTIWTQGAVGSVGSWRICFVQFQHYH